jgi:hypothetical protein
MTIFALVIIYFAVKGSVDRMSIYGFRGTQGHHMSRSSLNVKMVATRAILYSIAFLLTWSGATAWGFAEHYGYNAFWLACFWTVSEPLQGFLNALVFLHNRSTSKTKVKQWLSFGLWKPNDDSSSTVHSSAALSNTRCSQRGRLAERRQSMGTMALSFARRESLFPNQLETKENELEEGRPEMHPEMADKESLSPNELETENEVEEGRPEMHPELADMDKEIAPPNELETNGNDVEEGRSETHPEMTPKESAKENELDGCLEMHPEMANKESASQDQENDKDDDLATDI